MILTAEKTECLKGSITPPSSKSHSVRAVLLASISKGRSTLNNLLKSDDTEAALDIAKGLGASIESRLSRDFGDVHYLQSTGSAGIEETEHSILVTGSGLPLQLRTRTLFSRNSGISTKFTLPLLGLRADADETITLDVGEQMRRRPIMPLIKALNTLGMEILPASADCPFPLSVSGILHGGVAEVDGESSQYVSALLLALPLAAKDSLIRVKNLQERPYAGMTLSWLDRLGISYQHARSGDWDTYTIPGRQIYHPFETTISGDFSSASYIIAAAALIPGEVLIRGLDMNDPQSDKRLIEILRNMGADISEEPQGLRIKGGGVLQGITIDANDIPDMLPTLALIGTQAEGETRIVNVAHARIKETDRIHSMYEGLKMMGADIEEFPDGLLIRHSPLKGAAVKGYQDHRTVMALAVAGMLAKGKTLIDTAEAIGKTYPGFVEDMQGIGGILKTERLKIFNPSGLIPRSSAATSLMCCV